MVLNLDRWFFMLFGVMNNLQTDLVSNELLLKIAKMKKCL